MDKGIRSSPVRHLMKSNIAPSDSEINTIRALITNAEGRIKELHPCCPLRNQASQTTASKRLKFIEAHKAILSPVRLLPTEILEEIFFYYADSVKARYQSPYACCKEKIAGMPWRLGHICHRWRKVALSLASLWDDIPKYVINDKSSANLRALNYLMRRSAASCTLKLQIFCRPSGPFLEHGIAKEIVLRSEAIEKLHLDINYRTLKLFQGLKGHLPNLRTLRLYLYKPEFGVQNLDMFEVAPALRQVGLTGDTLFYKVLLPWSQITHFEDESRNHGPPYVPLLSLGSMTCLHINRYSFVESNPASYYQPITLPNLHTLRVIIFQDTSDIGSIGLFLEHLTLPAIAVITILSMEPLIPQLVSMFARAHEPSRLQKLALRTVPLEPGELSAVLIYTPQLIQLDIDVPPTDDLLMLTYGKEGVTLVPMLQALYLHSATLLGGIHAEYFNGLAQVRCESSSGSVKDLEDAIMPSLLADRQTTLDTFCIIFDSVGSRDSCHRLLNDWLPSVSPAEAKAIDTLRCQEYDTMYEIFQLTINREHFERRLLPNILNEFLTLIEQCETITNNVLRVS